MTSAFAPDTDRIGNGDETHIPVMDDVEQSIARAFEAAIQHLPANDIRAFEQTYRDLGSQLDVMLARCIRRRNATSSFQGRLPDEIWAAIWEDDALTLSDWISLSHVCHAWRRLALLSPRLWRVISFVTRFSPECSCQACLDDEMSHLEVQFARLDGLLPRSCGLPLDLRLNCPYNSRTVSSNLIRRLADTLHPHTHRITKIQAGFADKEKLCSLIRLLDTLPALRYLSADTVDGIDIIENRVSVPVSRQQMPALENLTLSAWSFDYALDPFPAPEPMLSVQKVSYSFTHEEDLLRLFRSFPRLKSLTLCPFDENALFRHWTRDTANRSEIRKLVESVEDVTLAGLSSNSARVVFFDLFHRRDMKAFTGRFTSTQPPNPDFLAPFGDLKELDGVELVAHCIGISQVSVAAQTRNRRRQFNVHSRGLSDFLRRADTFQIMFSAIWEYLPLSSVDTLVVDAEMWAALPPSPPSSPSRTTELRIALGDAELYPFPWTGPHPAQFPALRRVVLESNDSYPEVAAGSLVELIRSLGIELGGAGNELELVVRDGVVLVGDEAALRGMCTMSREMSSVPGRVF